MQSLQTMTTAESHLKIDGAVALTELIKEVKKGITNKKYAVKLIVEKLLLSEDVALKILSGI